jgi:hypothetical protein
LFGYRRIILLRKAFVAHVGLRRSAGSPQEPRCWKRPRLSWSTISLMFSMLLSTMVVVMAMTAARDARPRSRTALVTIRAQETRYAVMYPANLPVSVALSWVAMAASEAVGPPGSQGAVAHCTVMSPADGRPRSWPVPVEVAPAGLAHRITMAAAISAASRCFIGQSHL